MGCPMSNTLASIHLDSMTGPIASMGAAYQAQRTAAAAYQVRARATGKHAKKYALRDAQRALLEAHGLNGPVRERTVTRSNGKVVNPNGVVLWRGPSRVDGAAIVCIATGLTDASANPKTGAEVQTFIMREDIGPVAAQAVGADVSVCGQCPFRWFLAGEGPRCYVATMQAPNATWTCHTSGAGYATIDVGPAGVRARALLNAAHIRAGSWGDPALVPLEVWQSLNVLTGYTHMWKHAWAQPYKAFLMASCDGPGDVELARSMGWRCYYVRRPGAAIDVERAVDCPSPRGVQCIDCGLCGGLQRGGAKDVSIELHGTHAEERATRSAIPTMETMRHQTLLRIL